jgi:hypothetical protein
MDIFSDVSARILSGVGFALIGALCIVWGMLVVYSARLAARDSEDDWRQDAYVAERRARVRNLQQRLEARGTTVRPFYTNGDAA